MKQIETWDEGITDSLCDELLASMTLLERQFLDRISRNSTCFSSLGLTERALARDFFVRGYLASLVKFIPKEEQDKIVAQWKAEDEAKKSR
jgi:hypothetical protein